jgi:hypothetical protein
MVLWFNISIFGGCMAKMKAIKDDAKKRRAKLLKEFVKLNGTVTDFAELHGLTRARMSQLINKAREE